VALEARHLANLQFPEVTRALRALSSAYVERRGALRKGAALDSAGKRAAFSLFYAPLHFLTVQHIVTSLGARPAGGLLVDLGCGTGTAGAAWAMAAGGHVRVAGLDRHPATVEEARWTYRQLRVEGQARTGDVARTTLPPGTAAVLAGYLLNELDDEVRIRVWALLRDAAARGAQVLVVEPIARTLTPWWDAAAAEALADGGRADEWRFTTTLPGIVDKLDQAAGLRHRELTARSIYLPGRQAGSQAGTAPAPPAERKSRW